MRTQTGVENQILDVSDLPAPEPMQVILNTLMTLKHGAELRVYHRKEPFPLYNILLKQGYAYACDTKDKGYLIRIWRIKQKEDGFGLMGETL